MATGKGMSTGAIVGIVAGIVIVLGAGIYFLTKKKTPAKPATKPVGAGTPPAATSSDMPALKVEQDTKATDDYTITLGGTATTYSKGDPAKTTPIDATWTVYAATVQDGSNKLVVSVWKNGKIVDTKYFV